jgi:ankyrin repeat protein
VRLLLLVSLLTATGVSALAQKVPYEDVKAIFQQHCYECHGPAQQFAGLRLDRKNLAMLAGRNKIAIVPGVAASSTVYLRISGTTQGQQMPPAGPLAPQDIATIKTWIDQGADWPEKAAADGSWKADPRVDPLVSEIRKGNFDAVKRAVGVNPELARARDAAGITLLMETSLSGSAEQVRWLLEQGADAKTADLTGATALLWAVEDAAKTRALLDAGADANAKSEDGRTPLFMSLEQASTADVIKALVEHGARLTPDRGVPDPLSTAARNCDLESMKFLVLQKPYDGRYPPAALNGAVTGDCPAGVQIILEKGQMSKAALSDALRGGAITARIDILRTLISGGADANAKDAAGTTVLMRVAHSDFADVMRVKLLLDHGADVNAHDENGNTALKEAKRKGGSKVVDLLVSAGAKE